MTSLTGQTSTRARGVPFVGRERELARLRTSFGEATAGRGSVVVVAGEAGIGKTRLCHEFEAHAGEQGAMVLWGRNHEASGAPPYWPWVHAVREWLAAADPARVADVVADVGNELATLFPELSVSGVDQPLASQFQLFEALVTLLPGMSAQGPLVVVLDDLHWADESSLLLLRHVARELAPLPILIVGTYRESEVGDRSPLADTLVELARQPGFVSMTVPGLSEAEVGIAVRAARGSIAPLALIRQLYEASGGNAFLLNQLLALMVAESLTGESIEGRIPGGVKPTLKRRLERLSSEALRVMQSAAVLGREFELTVLKGWNKVPAPLPKGDCERRCKARPRGRPGAAPNSVGPGTPLTHRESEVLRMLAAGLRNREIADQLVISERTVERHVSNIYGKLDATNRIETAMWAVRHGLTE